MNKNAKIYVAGHQGMVGSAIVRRLENQGYRNLLFRTRAELDLTSQAATLEFMLAEKPDYIFLAAAKVGGIQANNTQRAQFIYENLMIEANVIHSAWKAGVERLMFMGTSCIYPRECPQPMLEEYLLTGPLEPTNEAYALAKIAGLKMCEHYNHQYGVKYIAVMPCNLYGPNDNYDPVTSHVLPALMRRFHEAKQAGAREVVIWGTGSPLREFLHVDDLADACVFLMNNYSGEQYVHVGGGEEFSTLDLARQIAEVVGFEGEISTDPSKPDGIRRKLLDSSFINRLGWKPSIDLSRGLTETYQWYLANQILGRDI